MRRMTQDEFDGRMSRLVARHVSTPDKKEKTMAQSQDHETVIRRLCAELPDLLLSAARAQAEYRASDEPDEYREIERKVERASDRVYELLQQVRLNATLAVLPAGTDDREVFRFSKLLP